VIAGVLAAFEPPTTKDFVWPCWGPSLRIGGVTLCLNFVTFLVLLGFILFIAFFSPVAFIAALVPATIALLVLEIRLLSGRFAADLWTFPSGSTGAQR
jgi:hypothetical protein